MYRHNALYYAMFLKIKIKVILKFRRLKIKYFSPELLQLILILVINFKDLGFC